jgi:hypothetical protein
MNSVVSSSKLRAVSLTSKNSHDFTVDIRSTHSGSKIEIELKITIFDNYIEIESNFRIATALT